MRNRQFRLGLAAILVLAVVVRLFFWVGIGARDDVDYCEAARVLIESGFDPKHYTGGVFATRLGIVFPIAVSWWAFGVTPFGASLYSLLCGTALVAIGGAIGARWLSPWNGIITALLLCFLPIDVLFSTQVMPDLPQAAWIGLAVLSVLWASKKSPKYFALTGILVALSGTCKEFAVAGLLFIPLIVFIAQKENAERPSFIASLCWLAMGSLPVAALDFLWFGLGGNALAHIEIVLHNAKTMKNINPISHYYLRCMFDLFEPPRDQWFGFLYYYSAIGLLVSAFLDRKKALLPIIWGVSIYVFLEYLGPFLAGRTEVERMERFLIPLSIPACLLAAGLFTHLTRLGLVGRCLSLCSLAVLLASMIRVLVLYSYPIESAPMKDALEISSLLEIKKTGIVYADGRSAKLLNIIGAYNNKIRRYDPNGPLPKPHTNSWLVVNGSIESFLVSGNRKVPSVWELVGYARGNDVGMYGRFDPSVYRAANGESEISKTN